jgi:hypothetical protein
MEFETDGINLASPDVFDKAINQVPYDQVADRSTRTGLGCKSGNDLHSRRAQTSDDAANRGGGHLVCADDLLLFINDEVRCFRHERIEAIGLLP